MFPCIHFDNMYCQKNSVMYRRICVQSIQSLHHWTRLVSRYCFLLKLFDFINFWIPLFSKHEPNSFKTSNFWAKINLIFPNFSSEVDAFVSNQSKIYITEPDLWSDPSEVITYDLTKTNTEIEATCTGYGGNPEPTFHW